MKKALSSASANTSAGILSSHVRWISSRPCQCPAEAMEKPKQNSVSRPHSTVRKMVRPVCVSSHEQTR